VAFRQRSAPNAKLGLQDLPYVTSKAPSLPSNIEIVSYDFFADAQPVKGTHAQKGRTLHKTRWSMCWVRLIDSFFSCLPPPWLPAPPDDPLFPSLGASSVLTRRTRCYTALASTAAAAFKKELISMPSDSSIVWECTQSHSF
jgi:hypothetical protein